ncbi:dimethylaniline monooxygenase [N-oxide-forming] 2-like [Glandiceps talaboti]
MAKLSDSSLRVAIIGAGVGGLTSIKSCLGDNVEPVCYEKRSTLGTGQVQVQARYKYRPGTGQARYRSGGMWNYSDEITPQEGAALYRSTVLNTSKEMVSFSDFPFPEKCTPYVTHKRALKYLQDYAEHFDLEKYIRFNTNVMKLERNGDSGKFWKITIETADNCEVEEYFDYVMVCTGVFSKQHMPEYPGLDNFKGIKIHANEYRDAWPYRGKKVLVVGASHTAGDIGCDIARNNAEVYMSMRHGTLCLSRIGKEGIPSDLSLFTRHNVNKPNFRNILEDFCKTQRVKDYKLFGLQGNPALSIMINDEIQDRIIQGQLTPVVGIEEFDKNSVKLKDGTVLEDIDVVIFATGYEVSIPIIKQSWIYDDSDNLLTYKYIFPLAFEYPERLSLIGIVPILGTTWPVYEIQTRLATKVFTQKVMLPSRSVMLKDIHQKPIITGSRCHKKISSHVLMDDLAEEFGVKPSFWRLALTDPKLAYSYLYGPVVPYWYRLQGPGAWSGARNAILNVWENTTYSTRRYRDGTSN